MPISSIPTNSTNYANMGQVYSSLLPSLDQSYSNLNTQISNANEDPSNPVNVLNAQTAMSQFTLTLTMMSQLMSSMKSANSEMIQNIR